MICGVFHTTNIWGFIADSGLRDGQLGFFPFHPEVRRKDFFKWLEQKHLEPFQKRKQKCQNKIIDKRVQLLCWHSLPG